MNNQQCYSLCISKLVEISTAARQSGYFIHLASFDSTLSCYLLDLQSCIFIISAAKMLTSQIPCLRSQFVYAALRNVKIF